ncbi:VWA domain-containing protein [Occallatibacter riparius]|uniref:VWA domain-containing protein n=1 Tax=Occallatibacter riparius TaxID=1002689 RepID=A0A9J7BG53_9BACT|nr:VWA domain-containing protein [Occallatibacter riparius]UWZ81760.1 VWA domain-containing protein [Occallatibacter riparius]
MRELVRKALAVVAAISLLAPGGALSSAQQDQNQPAGGFVIHANAELVLTNVVARDAKTGEVVRDLKQSDFTVFENGKKQEIASFDFQSVEMATPLSEATVSGLAAGGVGDKALKVAKPEELRNHRLIVFFFDLTSMQPEDLDRSVDAAREFLKNKMSPADLIALVSLGDTLKVDQDFTADKDALIADVGIYNGTEGQGFAQGATANSNQTEDTTGYTPDESEYNDINTDRELFALRAVAKSLEKIQEKKSLLYFSGGISRDGIENQASLRAAVNAAVRANLAIYSVDTRGLQAVSPVGDASTGSLRGQGAYNGGALANNMSANFASQEVMATLSSDTGGKAFFDSNDFAPAFAQVQKDTSAYYAIGFHSTNPLRDGKYRKLTIKVNRPGVKLEYRQGYYAPADFAHSVKGDREQQLEEQLASDLPATDMSVYLDAMYFRLEENRFYVPVSLVVPGSQIPFVKGGDKDKATLDIIGTVMDEVKRPIGRARETVKLNLDRAVGARQKNIQYTTSFNLPAGKYHLKFVVRENQTGRMGSFEADIALPEMKKLPLKMSSIVLASARQPSKHDSPLVRNGEEYVPNISHVFRQDQHLYLLYEVYGPAKEKLAESAPKGTKAGVNVLSSLELLQGAAKVYETPVVKATTINVPGREAVAVELDVPLNGLKPGQYVCQLNVIDDAGGSFAFPRFAVLVRESVAQPSALGSGSGGH